MDKKQGVGQIFNSIRQARNLTLAGIMVIVLISVGTIGYMYLEQLSLIDALYMTIITITTVGFREVAPPNDMGKIFTIFLIFFSVGIMGYTITNVSRLFLDGHFQQRIKYYNIKKRIVKLKDHVIVCGYGRNGFQACEELADHNIDFIVVEKRDHVVEMIREVPDRLFIQGDASSEDILNQAQISNARALITALPNDADNIYVVLTARELNPHIKIISRASEFRSDMKLRRAGADNVIMPDRIGGQRMAKLVAQADVVEFWEYVLLQRAKDVKLETISCGTRNPEDDNTLSGLKLRQKTGANIVGIRREDGSYIFNPPSSFELNSTDTLFVLGAPSQIDALRKLLA